MTGPTTKASGVSGLTRREAILRVSAMLGGAALVGQTAMLAACSPQAENNGRRRPSRHEDGRAC